VDIKELKSRRQFFAGISRYTILGLLGAAGVSVTAKRHRLLREGKCVNEGICRRCAVFDDCGLPRAIVVKEMSAGYKDDRKSK
jgi:hypothetical protein